MVKTERSPGQRVLIVEDNRDLAANLGDYLERHGWLPDFATDGRMALNLLSAAGSEAAGEPAPYDAVVLDLTLPRVDGLEVARSP